MGTTESNVDHAASGQTVAGDSGELTFTYAQGRFASEGKDWESPVVTNMAASVSADAGNVPAGSITNTGTSTTESSLATLLSNQCPFVIKATIFEGNGKNTIRERHTFTGSVLRQLDQASALLNGINESGQYPAIALREALVNALEHRDYTYSGPTLINIFDSRLEIVSLGGLTDGLEINDLLNGVCQPRTPRLAELFADLGLCENCGTGIQRIMDAYAQSAVSPQLRVGPTSVAMVLPIPVSAEAASSHRTDADASAAPSTTDEAQHAKMYSFPTIQRMTDNAADALAGARIIGCAPLQTLILGSGFGERPDGDDQASTRPLDTATLEPSPQTLEQFTLNFLAFRGVKLSRKTMQKALGLNKDQMTQLLDQLELSGKIERHTHAKSTTYSLAHASGR